jgi:thymidylate kinase
VETQLKMNALEYVNIFLDKVFTLARQDEIKYVILGGYKAGIVLDVSDIDILFYDHIHMNWFSEILRVNLEQSGALKLVRQNRSNDSEQWIVSCGHFVFMFDLFTKIHSYNVRQFDGDLFFEFDAAGLDLSSLVNIIKRKPPQHVKGVIPDYIYVFERKKITALSRFYYRLGKIWDNLKSLFSPKNGVFIVFLGCDGTGKSSVIQCLNQDYFTGGRSLFPIKYFHWRPVSRKKGGELSSQDALDQKPYSYALSIIKAIYLLCVFWTGFLFFLLRPLHRGFILLGDRYFYDILVDPARYRYGGPAWLVSIFSRYVPRPDIVILLDAPPEVIVARKNEATLTETRLKREKYLALMRKLENAYIVNSSGSLESTVRDVENIIMNYLSDRISKGMG